MLHIKLTRFLALQTLFVCAILASVAVIQNHALRSLEIGSPAYREIVDEKDLIADILPPPLFVTEAYMLSLESAAFPERAGDNAEKIAGLRKDFMTRRDFWKDRGLPDEEARQLQEKVVPTGEAFWAIVDRKAGSGEEAAKRLEELRQAFQVHRAEVVKLVDIASNHLSRSEAEAADAGSQWNLLSLVAAAAGLLIAIGGAWLIYWRAVKPVVTLTDVMERLAHGDHEVNIPGAERHDEIGSMARVMEVFRSAALDNSRLQEEAEASRSRSESDRITLQARAEAEAAERLRQATSGFATGLRHLAAGDLSLTLSEPFSGEFEALRADFNNSVVQLSQALREITGSVQLVDSEASSIHEAAAEVGRHTDIQSAALTETAMALTQISTNVQNNTRRTEAARQVAETAAGSATQSAGVVKDAVSAMQRIEDRSREIANIIGVIDEIAFQTNLLALNAGVEAARAGEAGKGFAVVAQEVRELAQRTGQAAREIKALIQTSSKEVEGGVALVHKTGAVLDEIGTFIDEMNDHMVAIHRATSEQAAGLGEVDQAVSKMDTAIKQNSSMVERQVEASDRLAREANRLARLMARFKLEMDVRASRRSAA